MMEITAQNVPALRRVMKMSLEAIFDGNSVDSMSSSEQLFKTRNDCRAFLELYNEFQRNMEPVNVSADDIDRVCERLNYVTTLLGDWVQEY